MPTSASTTPSERAGRSVLDFDNTEAIAQALSSVNISEQSDDKSSQPAQSDWLLTVPPKFSSSYLPQDAATEAKRLSVLRDYMILETEQEESFNILTQKAATKFAVPWAIISLVDMGRQWFKAFYKPDLETTQTARQHSFCTHTIQNTQDVLVVGDASRDVRFASSPLLTDKQQAVRFYAGASLVVPEGVKLGTLCVVDTQPRPDGLTAEESAQLKSMADEVVKQLVTRKNALWIANKIAKRQNEKILSSPISPRSNAQKHTIVNGDHEAQEKSDAKKSKTKSTNDSSLPKDVIPRPGPEVLLPNPNTDGVDPDTYLSQLVQAVYGVKLQLKTALELGDYFPKITEEQLGSYSMEVVSLARNNNTEGLREIYRTKGREALDCFNRFGEGLLNLCCRRGFTQSVAFLLSDSIQLSVRVRDDFGRTPLHDACWNPEPLVEICHNLMMRDPSLFFITDKRGYTPFQYARKTDWPLWRKFLLERKDLLLPLVSDDVLSRFT